MWAYIAINLQLISSAAGFRGLWHIADGESAASTTSQYVFVLIASKLMATEPSHVQAKKVAHCFPEGNGLLQ